jgi:hypothetical protein
VSTGAYTEPKHLLSIDDQEFEGFLKEIDS